MPPILSKSIEEGLHALQASLTAIAAQVAELSDQLQSINPSPSTIPPSSAGKSLPTVIVRISRPQYEEIDLGDPLARTRLQSEIPRPIVAESKPEWPPTTRDNESTERRGTVERKTKIKYTMTEMKSYNTLTANQLQSANSVVTRAAHRAGIPQVSVGQSPHPNFVSSHKMGVHTLGGVSLPDPDRRRTTVGLKNLRRLHSRDCRPADDSWGSGAHLRPPQFGHVLPESEVIYRVTSKSTSEARFAELFGTPLIRGKNMAGQDILPKAQLPSESSSSPELGFHGNAASLTDRPTIQHARKIFQHPSAHSNPALWIRDDVGAGLTIWKLA